MSATVSMVWSTSDSPYTCLKDPVRTLALRRAIRQTVHFGDIVVDAGAGTGILSFFAAEAGAALVYAVEIDPGLAAALRLSILRNGFADRIVVVEGDATEVELPREVDVFIGELIETGLMDETQVAVVNALRARGVIGPRTRCIPERYTTAIDLVEVDECFYGFHIAAPFHEWPNYQRSEEDWLPTPVRALTAPATVAEVDLGRFVEETVERELALATIADGAANRVRISGIAQLAPGLVLGQTNALNGDKLLQLDEAVRVRAGERLPCQVRYRMGGGLGSFHWRT